MIGQPSREAECKNCGAPFIRYNTIQALCRECSLARQKKIRDQAHVGANLKKYYELQGRERPGTALKPLKSKPRKPIKQQGKHAAQWKLFRDKVAIPYLDKNFGHVCSIEGCNKTQNLDVDHIRPRGSHPELRYVVANLRYLCRSHHVQVTGVPQWTKKAA